MALQVWLPLNGDLNNQGLSKITMTGTSVWKTSGKIGASALDLSSRISFTCPELNGIKYFSVCFWGMIEPNPDSTANWMDVFSLTDKSTSGTIGYFRFETGYGAAAQGGIHWHDNATNAIVNGAYTYNTATEQNKWHHICVTISSDKICSYYDGVLKQTHTSNLGGGSLTGVGWIGESTTRGGIQDLRIYDHALSAKEVEEISKGLILHYKFDKDAGTSDLITIGTVYNIYNNHNNTNMPSTLLATGEYYRGDKVYRETCTATSNSLNSMRTTLHSHGIYNWRTTFKANTKYVFWIYYKPISHQDTICGGTASNIGGWTEIPPEAVGNGWFRVGQYRNGTVTEDKTDNIFVSFKVPSITSGGSVMIDWASPHLLEGTTEILETDYSFNKIYDSSGYQNNGEIIENITFISDTPKYSKSIHMSATNQKVKISNFPTSGFGNSYTFTWWEKISSVTPMHWGFADGIRLNGMYTGRLWNTGDSSNNPLYIPGTTTQVSVPSVNVWHHWAMVGNGSKCLVYQDGELWAEAKTYKSISGSTIYINGWDSGTNYCSNNASMSDFRIYCTALTEKQIKELYNTSATADKNGNIYTREAVEL